MSPLAQAAFGCVEFDEDAEPFQVKAMGERFRGLEANLSEPHWLPPGIDADSVDWQEAADALLGMAEYCALKSAAGELRLAGKVASAMVAEGAAERHYRRLPEGWRW